MKEDSWNLDISIYLGQSDIKTLHITTRLYNSWKGTDLNKVGLDMGSNKGWTFGVAVEAFTVLRPLASLGG